MYKRLAILLAVAIFSACGKTEPPISQSVPTQPAAPIKVQPPAPVAVQTPSPVQPVGAIKNDFATMEKFMAIKNGMKEADVYAIMGGEGEVLSESEFGKIKTSMHMWHADSDFGNMNIMFQRGKVINKAQVGLK
ncbi:MAG: hypothetical protein ACRCV6_01330 [Formosimonas sp.]